MLPFIEECKPHKQSPKILNPYLIAQIKVEVKRLVKLGFIRMTRYLKWMFNIVLAIKKNVQLDFALTIKTT